MTTVKMHGWPDAMNNAIGRSGACAADVSVACGRIAARIKAAAAQLPDAQDEKVLELLDLYDAAIDLLRRWSRAVCLEQSGDSADAAIASILIHDFRPVRNYAVRLGEMIAAAEHRVSAPAVLAPGQ